MSAAGVLHFVNVLAARANHAADALARMKRRTDGEELMAAVAVRCGRWHVSCKAGGCVEYGFLRYRRDGCGDTSVEAGGMGAEEE